MLPPELNNQAVEETWEGLVEELREVESALAKQYGLNKSAARLELLKGVRTGEIPETDLVHRWLGLYSSFMRWLEHDDEPGGPTTRAEANEREAAESGLFFAPSLW